MGKPHPVALRERVIAFVDEGHCHREAARHFRVSDVSAYGTGLIFS